MQKIIAEALEEEISRYGLFSMGRRNTYIDYDRLSKAIIKKLEEYDFL